MLLLKVSRGKINMSILLADSVSERRSCKQSDTLTDPRYLPIRGHHWELTLQFPAQHNPPWFAQNSLCSDNVKKIFTTCHLTTHVSSQGDGIITPSGEWFFGLTQKPFSLLCLETSERIFWRNSSCQWSASVPEDIFLRRPLRKDAHFPCLEDFVLPISDHSFSCKRSKTGNMLAGCSKQSRVRAAASDQVLCKPQTIEPEPHHHPFFPSPPPAPWAGAGKGLGSNMGRGGRGWGDRPTYGWQPLLRLHGLWVGWGLSQNKSYGQGWLIPCWLGRQVPWAAPEPVQFSPSVVSALCDPKDCCLPGFPVHQQLLELAQAHVC